MDKDEQLLRKRFTELDSFITAKTKHFAYGGFDDAERKMLCFCGDEGILRQEDLTFPISCVKIEPQNQKFSDSLSHRDFLGAVLSLGVDRSKIGDILITDNTGYLFCTESIGSFLADQLLKIKHTNVSAAVIRGDNFSYQPKFTQINGTVSSERLDSILSVAFHSSRSSLSGLIEGGKVFVNGKEVTSNSYALKEGDIVSVRGSGKFKYAGTSYQTKKGRYSVRILLYS